MTNILINEYSNKIFEVNNDNFYIKNFDVKYRKFINHNNIGELFKKYLEKKYSSSFKEWIYFIYFYEISNFTYIYFKNFKIVKLQLENIKINDTLFDKIINKTIDIIHKNKIILHLDCITDIININDEIKILNKYDNLLIDFYIDKDEIVFLIKFNLFNKCKKSDVINFLNNKNFIDNYLKIKNNKQKVLFLFDKVFNFPENIYDIIKIFYLNGYWLDIRSDYYKDEINLNLNNILLHYDIIITSSNFLILSLNNLLDNMDNIDNKIDFLNKKLFIIISLNGTMDVPEFIKIEKKANSLERKKLNCINYLQDNRNCLESIISIRVFNYMGFYENTTLKINKIFNNIGKTINNSTNLLIYRKKPYDNTILKKKDFFEINNLDPKKKLCTIFLEWPQFYLFEPFRFWNYNGEINPIDYTERMIYFKNKLKKIVTCFQNNNYNVIFKIHPASYINIINNKIYLYNCQKNNNFDYDFCKNIGKDYYKIWSKKQMLQYKPNITNYNGFDIYIPEMEWGIKNIIENYTMIDGSFEKEILEYTDHGILFYPSSVFLHNYLYNIPLLLISNKTVNHETLKNLDWFNCFKKPNKNNDFNKKIWNTYMDYIKKNNININKDNIFDVNNIIYGMKVYWEDLEKDYNSIIKKFINTDFKKNYKYYKKHPLYIDAYDNNYEIFSKNIISIIKNKENLENSCKKLNVFVDKIFSILYCEKYINYKFENNIIIFDIQKNLLINDKLSSYGIHFTTFYFKNEFDMNISFECYVENSKEEFYPRIYTGKKWIICNKKVDKYYKKFNFKNTFKLNTTSKWRIGFTCKEICKIYLKNIKIYL